MQSRIMRVGVSQDYVIEKIVDTVERSLDYPAFEESGSSWLVDGKRRKFDATSVLKACELLGKHLEMFREKAIGVANDGLRDKCRGVRDMSDDEIETGLAALLALAENRTS